MWGGRVKNCIKLELKVIKDSVSKSFQIPFQKFTYLYLTYISFLHNMRFLFPFLFVIAFFACQNDSPSSLSTPLKYNKPKIDEPVKSDISDRDRKLIIERFSEFIRKQNYNGAVLVAKDNEIIFDSIVGYSNVRSRIKLNDSSAFQLASVSKPITAAVILSLIEEKKLNLNDTVTHILPNLPKEYNKITIRMLLSHKTGLTQYYYYCESYMSRRDVSYLSNDSLVEVIGIHNPGFCGKPGGKFDYCNTNYALLASVAEKLENKSFHDIVQERIIEPSGMSNSFLLNLKNVQDLPYQ